MLLASYLLTAGGNRNNRWRNLNCIKSSSSCNSDPNAQLNERLQVQVDGRSLCCEVLLKCCYPAADRCWWTQQQTGSFSSPAPSWHSTLRLTVVMSLFQHLLKRTLFLMHLLVTELWLLLPVTKHVLCVFIQRPNQRSAHCASSKFNYEVMLRLRRCWIIKHGGERRGDLPLAAAVFSASDFSSLLRLQEVWFDVVTSPVSMAVWTHQSGLRTPPRGLLTAPRCRYDIWPQTPLCRFTYSLNHYGFTFIWGDRCKLWLKL